MNMKHFMKQTVTRNLKTAGLLILFSLCTTISRAQLKTTPDDALKTPEGILKKAWIIKADTPLYADKAKSSVLGTFNQNAKAYFSGPAGHDLYAIGNKPQKEACDPVSGGFFGYVPQENILLWDTDQALRFSGTNSELSVAVFADAPMTDKVADFSVRPTDDPTVEPFPIFSKSSDGKAFEIACVLANAQSTANIQQTRQLKMDPNSLSAASSIDIAFAMDVTGSMAAELENVKNKVASLIQQFSSETIDIQGRKEPLRLRFAFIGYRDQDVDAAAWVPFSVMNVQ